MHPAARYGDEALRVCRCGHTSTEHQQDPVGPCGAIKCDCTSWTSCGRAAARRREMRRELDDEIPDGALTRRTRPTHCRWDRTKLFTLDRGGVVCLTCDVPAPSAETGSQ